MGYRRQAGRAGSEGESSLTASASRPAKGQLSASQGERASPPTGAAASNAKPRNRAELCSHGTPRRVSWFHTRLTEPFATPSTKRRCLRELGLAAFFQAACTARAPSQPRTRRPVRFTRGQETPAALPQTESEEEKQRDERSADTSVARGAPEGSGSFSPSPRPGQAFQTQDGSQGGASWGFRPSKGRFATAIKPKESIWLRKFWSCCLIPRQRS